MTADQFPYDRAVPGIIELQPYQPGKPIEQLERELGVANAIKLASNENPWGCSPLVLAAIRENLDLGLYPDANSFVLKEAIAAHLDVSSSHITLGNGSNDVLDLVTRVFVEPGDEVIYSEYAFLVYALVTKAVGGMSVVTSAKEWGHQLDAMSQAVNAKTKLIFIANPNNPTGTYVSKQALEQFLGEVPDNVVVVVDEAYFEYVEEDDYPNCVAWYAQYPNLVVTRTFSKIYGLASLRVGFSIASEEITDLLNRVRQPFNVNTLAQVAAQAALEDLEHVARCHDENKAQLQRLIGFCDEHGLGYIPSVANFVSVEFGDRTKEIYQSLLHKGVIVRPLDNYGMPNHLRITVGRENEMSQLYESLKPLL
ncbi:MAG: histidinol-phosphate transaminase [Arenicellales bacterium]|nr:histidinol-phosphate transaminase [Arenicellales bacterium]